MTQMRKKAKEFNAVIRTPLSQSARISVGKRFLRAFIPQIPAAVVVGIKSEDFWVGFGLTLLGALTTALDKGLREKQRVYKL